MLLFLSAFFTLSSFYLYFLLLFHFLFFFFVTFHFSMFHFFLSSLSFTLSRFLLWKPLLRLLCNDNMKPLGHTPIHFDDTEILRVFTSHNNVLDRERRLARKPLLMTVRIHPKQSHLILSLDVCKDEISIPDEAGVQSCWS